MKSAEEWLTRLQICQHHPDSESFAVFQLHTTISVWKHSHEGKLGGNDNTTRNSRTGFRRNSKTHNANINQETAIHTMRLHVMSTVYNSTIVDALT